MRRRLLATSLAALAAVGILAAQRAPAQAADPVAPVEAPQSFEQPITARPGDAPPVVTTDKTCKPADGSKRIAMCLSTGGDAPAAARAFTSADPEPYPSTVPVHTKMPWCDTRITTGYNRYEACLKYQMLLVEVFALPSMQLVGTAEFAFEQRIRTHQLDSGIVVTARFVPVRVDASIERVTLNYTANCVGACTKERPLQWGSMSWTAGDLHVAEVSNGWYWSRTGQDGAQDTLDLTQSISSTSPRGLGVSTAANYADSETTVRCDRQYANTEGCVLYKQRPTFTVDKAAHPAAYYFIGWTQDKMGGMGRPRGADGKEHPMHREADKTAAEANRRKICPSGWVKNEDTIAATLAADPGDQAECDEFPFAASKESGTDIFGNKTPDGDGCDQFYAYAAIRFPGKWSFGLDWRMGYPQPRPTGKYAPCGRASMPGNQNGGVGNDLKTFHGRQRVLDNDPYFVDSGGFPFRLPSAALQSGELRAEQPGTGYSMCLSPLDGPVSPGIGMNLWGCAGQATQQWDVRRVTSGVYEIKNRAEGLCLTAGADGSAMGLAACAGTADQLWATTFNHMSRYSYSQFEVRNTSTGKCLGTSDGAVGIGARVVQRDCADTPDQNWF
ncbi:RICIN domain-containing protein [Actinorhabdospora filicis]|nr:RICIN domain-containing protein [Actinorhabdospora filicis]